MSRNRNVCIPHWIFFHLSWKKNLTWSFLFRQNPLLYSSPIDLKGKLIWISHISCSGVLLESFWEAHSHLMDKIFYDCVWHSWLEIGEPCRLLSFCKLVKKSYMVWYVWRNTWCRLLQSVASRNVYRRSDIERTHIFA